MRSLGTRAARAGRRETSESQRRSGSQRSRAEPYGSEGRDSIVQPSSLASWCPARQVMLTGGLWLVVPQRPPRCAAACRSCRARGVDKRTRHPGHEAAGRRRGKPAHDRPAPAGQAVSVAMRKSQPVRSGQGERGGLVPAGTSIRPASRAANSLPSAAMASHWSAIKAQLSVSARFSQADPGQPGQASRRACQLHQAGDALAVGILRGPSSTPSPARIPSRARAARKLISSRTRSPTTMVRHRPSPWIWHRPGCGHRSCPSTPKVRQPSGRSAWRRCDDPKPLGAVAGRSVMPKPRARTAALPSAP